MAALSAVNMLASPPANGRASPASPEPESDRFEQMYSRELNRSAEPDRERPQPQTSSTAEPAEEASAQAVVADLAVVDPLLASLQLLLTPQMAQLENVVPVVPEEVMDDASGLEKNPLLGGLWSGNALTSTGPQQVESTLPVPANQALVAGKNLPSPADAAANSASVLVQVDAQLAEAMSDGEFDQSLQASLQVQPGQARSQAAASTEQVPVLARHVVAEPVGEGKWGEVVAQRVSMMLGRQEQRLEMQLNPPNLGPMEVRLSLGAEQASIVFTSQHAAVREALAAATPRLTALLADQGIVLRDVQVASDSLSQQQFQQAYQQQDGHKQRGATSAVLVEGVHEPVMLDLGSIRVPVARSGVSLYV